ncbi:hypothetical protein TVAG_364020 [Trichomonas vaginalis G3]|uniref:Uncharacterized protein n=1 Tax=Trichomonas vaginalis (strain ATCC PRA-98 / G3) TaxID=412133 RepID=A2EDX1_TRIV3|nr:aspartic-type endopeptidase protein [Trichomonas vaginalis G3]EAY09187.1 hypothetical protein TVAG_364020 [Trichomonas vaginalis G3]KAI5487026.1 aspartic-type endopeptidase protein [Trichomonas vaginalis G3]|eukprot:XP_001321410.1 hypothetical protein [Trichomonas vaginalis G3]
MLLHHGTDPNIQDGDGYTPLHWAVQKQNENFVEILVEFKANSNFGDFEGITPLEMAKAMKLDNILTIMERSKEPPPQVETFSGCSIFGYVFGGKAEPQVLPSKSKK